MLLLFRPQYFTSNLSELLVACWRQRALNSLFKKEAEEEAARRREELDSHGASSVGVKPRRTSASVVGRIATVTQGDLARWARPTGFVAADEDTPLGGNGAGALQSGMFPPPENDDKADYQKYDNRQSSSTASELSKTGTGGGVVSGPARGSHSTGERDSIDYRGSKSPAKTSSEELMTGGISSPAGSTRDPTPDEDASIAAPAGPMAEATEAPPGSLPSQARRSGSRRGSASGECGAYQATWVDRMDVGLHQVYQRCVWFVVPRSRINRVRFLLAILFLTILVPAFACLTRIERNSGGSSVGSLDGAQWTVALLFIPQSLSLGVIRLLSNLQVRKIGQVMEEVITRDVTNALAAQAHETLVREQAERTLEARRSRSIRWGFFACRRGVGLQVLPPSRVVSRPNSGDLGMPSISSANSASVSRRSMSSFLHGWRGLRGSSILPDDFKAEHGVFAGLDKSGVGPHLPGPLSIMSHQTGSVLAPPAQSRTALRPSMQDARGGFDTIHETRSSSNHRSSDNTDRTGGGREGPHTRSQKNSVAQSTTDTGGSLGAHGLSSSETNIDGSPASLVISMAKHSLNSSSNRAKSVLSGTAGGGDGGAAVYSAGGDISTAARLASRVVDRAMHVRVPRLPYLRWSAKVSVVFSDIVGFTDISSRCEPAAVLGMLQLYFSRLDALLEATGAFKYQTIGDAYVVVTGFPRPDNNHAESALRMAQAMIHVAASVPLPDSVSGGGLGEMGGIEPHAAPSPEPGAALVPSLGHLRIRVGVHTGQCASSTLGIRRNNLVMVGHVFDEAARLESQSTPGCIRGSPEFVAALPERLASDFRLSPEDRFGAPTGVNSFLADAFKMPPV